MALTSLVVAVTTALVVPFGTLAAYDVVLDMNAGLSVPGSIVRSISDASVDAFASATVISTKYCFVVLPSAAFTVVVIHVFGPATAQSDGDAFPGVHAPADDATATVALTSFTVAVTAVLVVPFGTLAA